MFFGGAFRYVLQIRSSGSLLVTSTRLLCVCVCVSISFFQNFPFFARAQMKFLKKNDFNISKK
jgi:hypothetical protein